MDKVENAPEEGRSRMGSVIDRSKAAAFKDQFFIVMVEQGKQTDRYKCSLKNDDQFLGFPDS